MRAVKPLGHLHTFDFHEQRAQQARDEFKAHGLQDYVTVYHRDVCELGFTAELDGQADAVFLDLPSPHTAVPHALRALKTSGMLSFPTVLQIQTVGQSAEFDFDSCLFELRRLVCRIWQCVCTNRSASFLASFALILDRLRL